MVDKDFNYNYWLKITIGIEEYLDEQGYKHFIHDNIDFKYAFSRKIYFILISKTIIRDKIKRAILNNENSITISLENRTARRILELMYKKLNFIFLENKVNDIQYKESLKIMGDIKKYDYIFVVHQTKFIRYFSSIFESLSNAVFILVNITKDATELCINKQYSYIDIHYNYIDNIDKHWDINSLIKDYNIANKIISQLQPKKVIVPEGNLPIGEVYNLLAHKNNIEIICIQQGWSPVCHIGFRNMHYDKFLIWGDKFKELLQPYNKNQKFIVTGSHVLNSIKKLNNNKSIGIFLQHYSGSIMFGKKQYDELINFAYKIAIKYPSIEIIIRKPPADPIEDYIIQKFEHFKNVQYMHPEDYTLDEVLKNINISISIHSTVLLESLVYNVIPIIFNNTSMSNYNPDIANDGIGIEVHNISDGLKKIEMLLSNNRYFNSIYNEISIFKQDYFAECGQKATLNIVKAIEE